MTEWMIYTTEKFEEWVDNFSTKLEENNPELAKAFRASYMEVNETPDVTKWAFWLYNELVYGDDPILNSIAWPLNMAFLDMMGAAFAFRGLTEQATKAQVMGKEILNLSVEMYSGPPKDEEE